MCPYRSRAGVTFRRDKSARLCYKRAMGYKYYPLSQTICHHFYNDGGCTFCGYHCQKRTVARKAVPVSEQIAHFEAFAAENLADIKKKGRLVIAPNGSWFAQVPQGLRARIYRFIEQHDIPALKYETRATLLDVEKALKEFAIMHRALGHDARRAKKDAALLGKALGEIGPRHIISFGLEVADDDDLATLNKGCTLDDYRKAAAIVRAKGASVGANILIAPPEVENPIVKAFMTAQFAVDEMGATDLLLMPCSPMLKTKAYDLWKAGQWNPVSATAASEVLQTLRRCYPDVTIKYLDTQIFSKHGRHGRFLRKPGPWSDKEKRDVRESVRQQALTVWPSPAL
ncbi:MAG: hypothetical protein U9N14_06540 [Pseudomonadota bacterium]|nr:hypothetical protein [Pseudomonadota bacterium]